MGWLRQSAIVSVLGILLALVMPVTAQSSERCFPETGHCIAGVIRTYWERNGGLAVFGFPTSAPRGEMVEGVFLTVQWFERDRLEIQPNGSVSAGRLGARMLELMSASWQYGNNPPTSTGCQTFRETGHQMCGPFAQYWQRNGGLTRFGFPLTGAYTTTIDGKNLLVQYFERRRFELHPNNVVMLGLLGNEVTTLQQPARNTYADMPASNPANLVSSVNGKLYASGAPFEVRGVNYIRATGTDPDACHTIQFGADGRCPWDMAPIEADFDRLHARGINTIRVFLNYYVFGGAIPIFNGTEKGIALQHFETLLNAANARGIYVMPVLYAKYPQTNFAAPYYAQALDVHARPLVRYFAGHPGIIAWDIFNEPDIGSPIDIRCWDWDNADYAGCYPLAQERLYFLSTVAQDIKQLDPTHLRTIGMAFAKSHAEPREAPLRIADMVDFYTFHYYDDSPYDSGRYKLHWYYGQGFPHDLRRSIQELHDMGLGKPIVVTELGFPTDPADGTRNDAELARDLARARDVLREMGTSGMVIWPFQSSFDGMIGDLYRR